jgi:hypothetical protein
MCFQIWVTTYVKREGIMTKMDKAVDVLFNIVGVIIPAIENTKKFLPEHWQKCLDQRCGRSGFAAGSVYPRWTQKRIETELRIAHWVEYFHPAIMAGCRAFKAAIPGRFGIVELSTLPNGTMVTLDDRKNTGKVSCVVRGVRGEMVDFTVIILGMEDGVEVVYTFHPGDPINPSQVLCEPGMHGKEVSVVEALAMGLSTVKIV